MARLIDADDIIETDFLQISEKYVNFLKDTVNQWPTVEAIPIEWLKDRYMDRHKQTWSAVVYDALLTILKDWEKENENISK